MKNYYDLMLPFILREDKWLMNRITYEMILYPASAEFIDSLIASNNSGNSHMFGLLGYGTMRFIIDHVRERNANLRSEIDKALQKQLYD